ncbi:MAG TPA: hypothetical protein VF193_07500 [Steroidobacter sp.]
MPQTFVLPKQVAFIGGAVAPGSVLRFYETGTTTPQAVYTDADLTNAVTSITADSAGVFPKVYLNPNASANYRVTLEDSSGAVSYTEDDISRFPVSQDEIGAALYPRTAAEVAAGVTPTNYAYEPGHVDRYGADPTGAVDSKAAIQMACDVGEQDDAIVVKAAGTYLLTGADKLVIKGNFDGRAAIFNVKDNPTIAVEVSTGNADDPTTELRRKFIYLPEIVNSEKTGLGWTGYGIGVRTVNLYESEVHVRRVRGFATGLLVTSFGTGTVYNNFFLQFLDTNQVNLRVEPGDASAWANQNNFYGGRFHFDSSEASSGTRHIYVDGDNNTFWGCSLEGNVPEYTVECPGSDNYFPFCRWEATAPTVRFVNTTGREGWGNVIFHGYASYNIVVSESGDCRFNQVMRTQLGYEMEMQYPMKLLNTNDDDVINVFDNGVSIWGLTSAATTWQYALSSTRSKFKAEADAQARISIVHSLGRIAFGVGTADPETEAYITAGANGNIDLRVNGALVVRDRATAAAAPICFASSSGVKIYSGAGTPEGAVTAPVGSLFLRSDGGAGTSMYVKESGTGNTGWVAK